MKTHSDVLIVGGGVIGLTAAFYLRRAGRSVRLIDRGDFGQESSWAGAGILSPPPTQPQTTLDRFAVLSARLHAELHAEMRSTVNVDNGYFRCEGYDLLEPDSVESHCRHWEETGVRFREITPAEVRDFEPGLAPGTARVFYFPDKAQLRNPRHVKGLLALLAPHVELQSHCPAEGWNVANGRIVGARTATGVLSAEQYLLTSGAWTESLLTQLDWRPGIHPVRGQIALLQQRQPGLTRIVEKGKRYLVPRSDGRVLVGSTEELAGFVKKTTAAGIADLLTFAGTVVPALADATVERCWAGLRPGNVDGLPVIGRVPDVANLFVAAGHFRTGIQFSTGTGQLITELMTGETPSLSLDVFRLDRPTLQANQADARGKATA